MRTLLLHPASLALGLVLGGIALLSMGQATAASSPLRIEYVPHPRDMVQIKQGTPYAVPAGRLFTLTALGSADAASVPQLRVNGQIEVTFDSAGTREMREMPAGFTAPAGATVEVVNTFGASNARAWGYLVAQ